VKVGVTLPHFRDDADTAIAAARRAEALGIDGVFCFDHLWPMGQPGRPAISSGPLLGAVAASTTTVALGTLVARIGLVPDDVLVEVLLGLDALSGGRCIAGIGTGDRLSKEENDAYGLPFEPAEERRARLGAVARTLHGAGLPVWLGGAGPASVALARDAGVAVNAWQAEPARVAEVAASGVEVTWGGPAGSSVAELVARLGALAAAGATWAVCGWPDSLELVAEAAAAIR
jgi:alkanesulfonate monooxygenase SsuD/methylene tetrahydromethanopterin reductase-like flavin-dependent oxidoreductase (luciferase family)